MIINGVVIDDTFSEAFSMRATRIIITAINYKWARHAAETMTGFATSVIGMQSRSRYRKSHWKSRNTGWTPRHIRFAFLHG